MWTRRELKEKAKVRFKANYWRSILISLILLLAVGGGQAGATITQKIGGNHNSSSSTQKYDKYQNEIAEDWTEEVSHVPLAVGIVFTIVFLIIFLIVMAVVLTVNFLLLNPLEIGGNRYFLTNLEEKAEVKEVCFTFDRGYKNGVKVMFFRDIFIMLWTLLFIIPGIVKSYEYRMIPFLLAEHPDMDRHDAFAISRKMMKGEKWNTFVLDLSFLGWSILSAITFGIVGVFYANPYFDQTNAALYQALCANSKAPQDDYQETI